MDLRIISVAQWGKQRTRERQDGLKDRTHIDTHPDDGRSTVYIDRNRDSITIKHTNDLPKYRCEYPNQREREAHYCQGVEYSCYNSVYHTWYDAYEARKPLSDSQPIC